MRRSSITPASSSGVAVPTTRRVLRRHASCRQDEEFRTGRAAEGVLADRGQRGGALERFEDGPGQARELGVARPQDQNHVAGARFCLDPLNHGAVIRGVGAPQVSREVVGEHLARDVLTSTAASVENFCIAELVLPPEETGQELPQLGTQEAGWAEAMWL